MPSRANPNIIAGMDKAQIGRRLVAGFDGREINHEIRFALRDLGAGGVILFARNYEEPAQLLELTIRLRELCVHKRLLICVDHEGGKVQRFREPFTPWPDAASFVEYGDAEAARLFGKFTARELAAVGVDVNFAPVCDVNTCEENPVIGRRSFSSDPKVVSEFAGAFIEGTQSEGVMACAKHFPGHGDTSADSHKELPEVHHPPRRIEKVELAPFGAAAKGGVALMMTAHVLYTGLDESLPATLSKNILGRARGFPYDGLIVTDDLEMAAVAERFSMEEAAFLAAQAGCDLLLCCHDAARQERIVKGLFDAVLSDRLPRTNLWDSEKRIENTLLKFPLRPAPPLGIIGSEEHHALAERIRRGS